MTYLSNSFSLQMLNLENTSWLSVTEAEPWKVGPWAVSCIGHADTARIVSGVLGREVPVNRTSIHLEPGDTLFVAQFMGGRLPEGATELPEGTTLKFIQVQPFHN